MWDRHFQFERSRLILGDCVEKLPLLPDNSVDMVLCDLPYGVTKNSYDTKLPLDILWKEYDRVLKLNGAAVFYAQGLFYVDLVQSNRKYFRYDLVWDKQLVTGFLNATKMPLRVHEQIAVFYRKVPTYNPQMTTGQPLHSIGWLSKYKEVTNRNYGKMSKKDNSRVLSTNKYPRSILTFPKIHPSKALHRTEKSIECNMWLINTYTNPGEVVLDNTSGSGTTGAACIHTNRNFILMEKNPEDFNIGVKRIQDTFSSYGADLSHFNVFECNSEPIILK